MQLFALMKLWKFKWINPNLRKYSLFKFIIIPDNFKVTVAFVRRLLILVIKTSTYIQYIYIYIYIYISYTYHIYAYIASLFQSIQTNFHREKLSLTETNIHIRVSSYLRRQNEMKFLIRNNLSMEKYHIVFRPPFFQFTYSTNNITLCLDLHFLHFFVL